MDFKEITECFLYSEKKNLMWQNKNWLNGHELKGKNLSKPDKKIQKTFFVWWKKLLMEKNLIWFIHISMWKAKSVSHPIHLSVK